MAIRENISQRVSNTVTVTIINRKSHIGCRMSIGSTYELGILKFNVRISLQVTCIHCCRALTFTSARLSCYFLANILIWLHVSYFTRVKHFSVWCIITKLDISTSTNANVWQRLTFTCAIYDFTTVITNYEKLASLIF